MDSRERDESKTRRREEMLARRVGEALDQLNAQNAGECPDAEVIAAYAERMLAPAESEQWEGHFATCARCRKILRVLAASADTPLAEKEVAQLGELVSAVRVPVGITTESAERARPRRVDWHQRWLAPALGVAAVLVVWLAMRPPWRAADRRVSGTLVAQAPKEEMPPSPAPAQVDLLSKVAPQKDPKTVAAPPDRLSTNTPPRNSPEEAPAKRSADAVNAVGGLASSAPDSRNRPQNEKKESARMDAEVRDESPSAPPPPPAAVPPPSVLGQATRSAIASPKAPESASQSVTVTEAAPQFEANSSAKTLAREKQVAPPQQAAGAPAAPAPPPQAIVRSRDLQGFAALKADQPAFIQATAPFGSTVWRLGKGGKIERSADGGETWNSQMSPILEDWLAGVAVSDMVCWAAGRNGSIARTTDGDRWERIAPPAVSAAANAKLPDWTGITARDAQSATITASDGRKFATADGGKTWQAQ